MEKKKDIIKNICTAKGSSCVREGQEDAIIMFVVKGSFSITAEDYFDRTIRCGEAILIPHAARYSARALEDLHVISFRFKTDSLLAANCPVEELASFGNNIERGLKPLKINSLLSKYLELVEGYFHAGNLNVHLLEIKRKELFHLLFTYYPRHEIAAFFHPVLGEDIEFREFILINCLNVRSIRELAGLAHYSPSGFDKKFRRVFNEAPYGFIMRKKAEGIKRELEKGNATFQEIAHKYKFSSYRHFLRFCQAQIGASPSKISRRKT